MTPRPSTVFFLAESKTDNPTLLALRGLRRREEVAAILGTSWPQLRHLLYRAPASQRYHMFALRKKGGGIRSVHAPTAGLKSIQRALAALLSAIYRPKASVHGFVNGHSVVTNAPRGVAVLFAQVACREGKLPQGAPSSPILSNMVCARLDGELSRLAKQARAVYSRYADDLTFSTNAEVLPAILGRVLDYGSGQVDLRGSTLESIIIKNVFVINDDKVRLLSDYHTQLVTGVKVNTILNVPRRYVRNLRTMLYDWEKNGYLAAERKHWAG